ncbi:MAG TPA: squalene--hopene cyclase [Mycobacteriales bacterium]|nr:squalene--hopene cyclase [Mycobacteriales bacterium]
MTAAPELGSRERSAVEVLSSARDHLLRLQDPAGWWKGELETNVTMDAEDLMLRRFLGIGDAGQNAAAARWIRSQQRPDGTWATFHGGPADLSTTVEAYVALRLAGDLPGAPHMARAAAYVRSAGGLERSRVFTRIWLALFGEWDWEALPGMPPEVILLPPWVPLNVYDFGCWARQTVVPLTVVASFRPRHDLGFTLAELRTGAAPLRPPTLRRTEGWLHLLDRAVRAYDRRPLRPLRARAIRAAERWILDRQEADGSWGGIQPPWVYSILALRLLGHPVDGPVLREALAGLDRFTVWDERGRRLEACQSPVWDTALAVVALADAGLPPEHPALVRAADWLLGEEVRQRGDWAVRRGELEPGGWAFEFANDWYPDIDDSAEVVLALDRTRPSEPSAQRAAVARAVDWMVGMRSRNGAWAAFDADNTRELVTKLPFSDFGAVLDPPTADVTAHVVEMLAAQGREADPVTRAAVAWLLAEQEPDGSWFGRWGVNHVYGTGAVLPALVAAGVLPSARPVRRAVRWLESVQNPDGGWGEDIRSYRDPGWRGRGASTASQSAWALLALLAAGERDGAATQRGVRFLAATQREDGTWDEPQFTGTGFPGDFSINYHLYRLVFPVTALGRYVGAGR